MPALLAALTACGGDSEVSGQGWIERPTLSRVQDRQAAPAVRRVRALEFPEDIAAWSPDREAIATELVDGRRVLTFEGKGTWSVRVPGPFALQEFNRVAVRGVFPRGSHVVQLGFGDGDGQSMGARALYTPKLDDGVEHTLVFELTGVPIHREAFDSLRLLFASPKSRVEVREVVLLHTPPALRLPDAEGEPALINLGDQARMGWGLIHGEPVSATFEVGGEDEFLALALAQEEEHRLSGRRPVVQLTVTGEAGAREELSVPLEDGLGDPLRWHDVRIDLDRFAGMTVTATATLECEQDAPAAVSLADLRHARQGADAPTVLLITSDTHRGDHVGFAPDGVEVDTPNLDALAARGTTFLRGWASTNITSPSHAALLTGVHPRDSRLLSNGARLATEAHTLGEAYRSCGYRTLAALSVRHLGPRAARIVQGFDQVHAPRATPPTASVAVEQLMRWIDESPGQPVFAWLHVFDAHVPYEPPPPFDTRYWPADRDPFDPALPALEPAPGTMPRELQGVRDLDWPRAQYRGEISYLDGQLGRILDLPRVRDGWVGFTSDHGEILEKDGTYFNHGAVFPDTLHVPLVVAGPYVPEGARVQARVDQIDLGRTLLDLSGHAAHPFPGENLLVTVEDESRAGAARFAMAAHGAAASVTRGPHHLVLNLREHHEPLRRKREALEVELYDLEADPDCLEEIHARDLSLTTGLLDELITWLNTTDAEPLSERRQRTREENQQLVALGYAGDEAEQQAHGWLPPGTTPATILERQ